MIESCAGNIVHANTDAIVCTVNCVGVMGKGVALDVKRAFPEVFPAYKEACDAHYVRVGRMFSLHRWGLGGKGLPHYVVCFPTKQHWRNPSELAWIGSGLTDLLSLVWDLGIMSIAIPQLGCGNGGLNWLDVKPLIVAAFSSPQMANRRIVLYEPTEQSSREAEEG